MTTSHNSALATLRRGLGTTPLPNKITQAANHHKRKHLTRLARLKRDERAEPGDLWEYTQDLLYTEIQADLFRYLLPFCMEGWRFDLLRTSSGYGGFVEYFYQVLADRQVFTKHLTPRQGAAVSRFMRQTILEEIDDQRGLAWEGSKARPYRWVGALNTYGVLFPDLNQLWSAWWALDTVGRAVAAVQYLSCLMYPEDHNPVFAAWTRDRGGGPPGLWEFSGHLYTHRWLQPNVEFLKSVLNLSRVTAVLTQAVERLSGQPEQDIAQQVLADVPVCSTTLKARCDELPRLLEMNQEPASFFEWSV